MKVEIYKPVICKTPHKNIRIFDDRGVLFYDSRNAKKFKGIFSLPKGIYESDNQFKIVRKLKRNKLKLLKAERNKKHKWEDFQILFGDNPNKCTIFHAKKIILFDNSFKLAPKYQLIFILLHEKGHNFFRTEKKADWYAIRGMWLRGYNKSQIGLAPLLTLSDRNYLRKKKVIKFLLNRLK